MAYQYKESADVLIKDGTMSIPLILENKDCYEYMLLVTSQAVADVLPQGRLDTLITEYNARHP